MATNGTRLEHELIEALRGSDSLRGALDRLPELRLRDCHLGAGCVAQTVWNLKYGEFLHAGITDYDLVYFDPDLSEDAERAARDHVRMVLGHLGVTLDVKNQARVHLWYRQRFGYAVRPYASVRDAINTWPTTATAVALGNDAGRLGVYAPFGLDDLFAGVVRANRVQITREIYASKVRRWMRHWPKLVVLPWEQGVGQEASRWIERPARSRPPFAPARPGKRPSRT